MKIRVLSAIPASCKYRHSGWPDKEGKKTMAYTLGRQLQRQDKTVMQKGRHCIAKTVMHDFAQLLRRAYAEWRNGMKELDYGKMGTRIRQVRKLKGWSQDELASRCGISMSFLGHIERGTRVMSLETFVNICGALDAGADELLWGVTNPSETVLNLWNTPDGTGEKAKKNSGESNGAGKEHDSYSMYVRIMKSVAEIMNGA